MKRKNTEEEKNIQSNMA